MSTRLSSGGNQHRRTGPAHRSRAAAILGASLLVVAGATGTDAAPARSEGADREAPAFLRTSSTTDRTSGTGRILELPVLMYHRITCKPRDAAYPGLWICPRDLDAAMRSLKSAGWETITSRALADSLADGTPLPRKRFVLVIDDGHRDGYKSAYPILERYGFEAVFAVVAARVETKRHAMTWVELRELEAAGHEIANHSMTHADLSRSGSSGLRHQVEDSSERLARHLGSRPRTFVYPYGRWDAAVVAQLRTSGYRIAYTTAYGARHSHGNRFASPRIRINRGDSPDEILAKVRPYA